MKRIRLVNDVTLLYIIGGICLYVLISAVFPIIRIPYSILDNEGTKKLNLVLENLAGSYLAGLLVYRLTVVLKHKIGRKRRFGEINALFENMREATVLLEEQAGKRIDRFNLEDYKEFFTAKLRQRFCAILSESLEKANNIKDILTDKEDKKISLIKNTYHHIEVYYEFMDINHATMEFNALVKVCKLIDELLNSVIIEVQKKGKTK